MQLEVEKKLNLAREENEQVANRQMNPPESSRMLLNRGHGRERIRNARRQTVGGIARPVAI